MMLVTVVLRRSTGYLKKSQQFRHRNSVIALQIKVIMSKNINDLKWQLQMGIDEVIAPQTKDRTKRNIKAEQPAVNNTPLVAGTANISNPNAAKQNTLRIAQSCNDIESLKAAIYNFQDLSIAKTATNTVFGDGNVNSEIMLIGEAPGAEEDLQGIPFCGPSGQLLDQMLACIGLSRQQNFYITNTIFWRPPGNRRPTPEELAICLPFVEKHIALIQPKIIVLVGGTAIASLLNSKEGITTMRGKFFDYQNQYLSMPVKTTAIFHPSYLLRSPGQKRIAWQDMLMLQQYIKDII